MFDRVRSAYLEGKIYSSDPLSLVCLLYDSALQNVEKARDRLQAGDIPGRSKAISKAYGAVDLLAASLNLQDGGEVGRNLLQLYLYMEERLLTANIEQSDQMLEEVQHLLANLRGAWAQLAYDDQSSREPRVLPISSDTEISGGPPPQT